MKIPDDVSELDDQPDPPLNVRVLLNDGTAIPCEVVYEGLDAEGAHQWIAQVPIDPETQWPERVQMDRLPARTGVRLEFIAR
jgi:hypothetical protein